MVKELQKDLTKNPDHDLDRDAKVRRDYRPRRRPSSPALRRGAVDCKDHRLPTFIPWSFDLRFFEKEAEYSTRCIRAKHIRICSLIGGQAGTSPKPMHREATAGTQNSSDVDEQVVGPGVVAAPAPPYASQGWTRRRP